MKLKLFQVDAFTDKLFGGNPAAICPLQNWLPESLMQSIAAENNLAETAFYVPEGDDFEIRWFTPTVEVALCRHATLASAHVMFEYYGYSKDRINFYSKSGVLTVTKSNDLLTLNFPTDTIEKVTQVPDDLIEALKKQPSEIYKGKTDYMVVFDSQKDIENIAPDLKLLSTIKARGVMVTAKGDKVDFVSRFFGPQSGIDEDPVTGSAHTTLIPYWAKKLNKDVLTAQQLSARKGDLWCKLLGDRVEISGKTKTYLIGEIETE